MLGVAESCRLLPVNFDSHFIWEYAENIYRCLIYW